MRQSLQISGKAAPSKLDQHNNSTAYTSARGKRKSQRKNCQSEELTNQYSAEVKTLSTTSAS